MKTLADIDKNLQKFEKKFGLTVRGAPQTSEAWFRMKLGVLSASNASKIVAKKGTDTRATYMASLVAQVCTGVIEEFSTKEMDWGREHEDGARSAYEFSTGLKVTPLTFVFKDDKFRVGCSPDGIVTAEKGVEYKCPFNSANYVKFLIGEGLKSEWEWQNNMTMWVMGAKLWDVSMVDPRMKVKPFHCITVEADPKKQDILSEAIPEFIHDMDKILAEIGVTFGSHWTRIAEQERREQASEATA